MASPRAALVATGTAFAVLGTGAAGLGVLARWLDVRPPIELGIPIGLALLLCGIGLLALDRRRD